MLKKQLSGIILVNFMSEAGNKINKEKEKKQEMDLSIYLINTIIRDNFTMAKRMGQVS